MDALATILLRRAGAVALPAPAAAPPADGDAWVANLEADLAATGWLLDAAIRQRFVLLDPVTRMRWAEFVCAVTTELVGADREHVPLFRRFPDTPADTDRLYVERLIVHLLQTDAAPCILCGAEGRVHPLDPCGHLVCAGCFDADAYTACPICGRRLTAGNSYLPLVAEAAPSASSTAPPVRLRRLTLDSSPTSTAVRLRDDLVRRPAALGEADLADLRTLVAATAPDRLDWLPAVVPARETLAVVIAEALHRTALTAAQERVLAEAAARWGTATDVARALWVYSGGDPGLVLPRRRRDNPPSEEYRPVDEPAVTVGMPRVRALPRPLRRTVLTFLGSLGPVTAAEDMARHPTVWKRLAERLHPYERVTAYPDAAVAFAALRGTGAPGGGALGTAMVAAAERAPERLILSWHADGTVSVRVRTFAALVERAVAEGDAADAAALLVQRPGDLWRRLDHLLRLAGDDPDAQRIVLDAARQVAPRVSPTVLADAAAALTGRDATVAVVEAVEVAADASMAEAAGAVAAGHVGAVGAVLGRALGLRIRRPASPAPARGAAPGEPRRTFFPKGDVVRTWSAPERRRRLPADAIAEIRAGVDAELVDRAGGLDRFDVAVLDVALGRVPAPRRERAGSAQLTGWPRGSVRRLPDLDVLRLFLHWTDGEKFRVDLDLSCAFYDRDWTPRGHCDYTRLRFKGRAAIHSGDLTSAPPPLGATEFLDLDRAALLTAGIEWAVPVVFSYNDVPFEALDAAFAGFSLPERGGRRFDPARVVQRFNLRGDSRSLAPLVLNLRTGEVMWIDASLSTAGYGHNVGGYGARLGRLAADLWEHFCAATRPTLLDLAAWHASARADRIVVAHADGTTTPVQVGGGAETVAAVRAAATRVAGDGVSPRPQVAKTFVATVDQDRLAALLDGEVADGSAALLLDGSAGAPWTPVSAADLAAGLVPL
ncbi:MXAN_6230/SCO0854 family RING domain-containing protein [Micromonospora sp. NPDC004540]|uniref:MXAN_6230/SCO0854 family RING domain-containing protein n=1 Tax=Micromonospora sp. NPDC004540 TaxID=3154457 RepID=UPI0033A32E57